MKSRKSETEPRRPSRVRAILLASAAATAGAAAQDDPPASQPSMQAQPMPVPFGYIVPRGTAQIVVDGSLQDWPDALPIQLDDSRQLSGTAMGAWRGPEDLVARGFFLWDEEDLYFAGVVKDDWHRPLTTKSSREPEIPPADNIVLSFDPHRDTRFIGPDEGRAEDREFWIADVQGQERKVVQWDRLHGSATYAEGAVAVVSHDRKSGSTSYEARIPWRAILSEDMHPHAGLVFDMQVVVNDYDEITDPMPQTRIGWTFGSGVRLDPGLRGSMMLLDAVDPSRGLPEIPPAPQVVSRGLSPASHWVDLSDRLAATAPVPVRAESPPAEQALGDARSKALHEIEEHLAAFPRVDFIEYLQRVDRRMRRETAGMLMGELPFFWDHRMAAVVRSLEGELPAGVWRVYRLPVAGWMVRTGALNLGIDAAGADLELQIGAAFDTVLLTEAPDLAKRNDQVLLRLAAAKRPFYAHRLFHLPGVDAAKMPVAWPGETTELRGVKIRTVGTKEGDVVSRSIGYVLEWPDGHVLVHSGQSMTPEQLQAALPAAGNVDLLLLSAKHPQAVELAKTGHVRLVALDDVLECSSLPGESRVPLASAFALQEALRPIASVIVGPGEALDIPVQ